MGLLDKVKGYKIQSTIAVFLESLIRDTISMSKRRQQCGASRQRAGVISAINESMLKNTSRNYDPKQREFKVRRAMGCNGRAYPYMLRARLGVLYGEAIPRRRHRHGRQAAPLYRGPRRKPTAPEEEPQSFPGGYVTAITKLYSTQK